MPNRLDRSRDVVIFDCDGVFYSWGLYGGMEGAKNFCADVKADVVPAVLPNLTREDAMSLGRRSYEETGDGLRYFVDMAQAQGQDPDAFRERLHQEYHRLQMERVRMFHPEVLAKCEESLVHLTALNGRVRVGMISQSCRENWLTPLLTEKGVLSHIEPDFLYGFREFGWHEKSASANGLGMIMDAMAVTPSRVVFVEDTKANLKPVRDRFPDVFTVYLHDYNARETGLDYVDLQVRSNLDFLRAYSDVHCRPAPSLQHNLPAARLGL